MDQQPTRTLNWHRIILCFLLLLNCNSVSFADNASSSAFILPPPHQSTYILKKYGTEVGEINNQLSYSNDKIIYRSAAKATGVASLFFSTSISEESVLRWSQNATDTINIETVTTDTHSSLPQLLSYRYTNPAKKKNNQQISLDWLADDKATITLKYRKKTSTLKTDKPLWSRQFLPIVMSSDLMQNTQIKNQHILTVEKDQLESYIYTRLENEKIEFQGARYPCIKFEIKNHKSNRVSHVWLAKAFDYLPIKIEQYNKGELDGSLQLKQFIRTQQKI